MITYLIAGVIVFHLVLAGINLWDLFNKSKRRNKQNWAILIVVVPIAGVIIYEMTKKRNGLA